MKLGLIGALARGIFAMDAAHAEAYMPFALRYMQGEPVSAHDLPGWNEEGARPYVINQNTGQQVFCRITFNAELNIVEYSGMDATGTGAVLVIPIEGPIMKYDWCGTYGSMTFADIVKLADANSNIVSIVLAMDTPGGEVYGTRSLTQAIAACSKPVYAHVHEGICASAGYYIASAADKIYVSQPTDMVGSIGVYQTMVDYTGRLEKEGAKVRTVYSPDSPDKNKEFRAAMAGDEKPAQAMLKVLDDWFMSTVRENRPNVDESALKGEMLYAADAQRKGLIDGMKSFEEVLVMAAAHADNQQSIYITQ